LRTSAAIFGFKVMLAGVHCAVMLEVLILNPPSTLNPTHADGMTSCTNRLGLITYFDKKADGGDGADDGSGGTVAGRTQFFPCATTTQGVATVGSLEPDIDHGTELGEWWGCLAK
jgi:hypothetical protein